MLRALVEPGLGVRLEEVLVPEPRAGEVLVRSTLVGICGSDTHALAGHHPFLTAPYVPGHEATGVVVSFGAEVYGFALGQRVLLKPNVACGACANCLAGRTNTCESLAWIGCDSSRVLAGAMAEYFVAPARTREESHPIQASDSQVFVRPAKQFAHAPHATLGLSNTLCPNAKPYTSAPRETTTPVAS